MVYQGNLHRLNTPPPLFFRDLLPDLDIDPFPDLYRFLLLHRHALPNPHRGFSETPARLVTPMGFFGLHSVAELVGVGITGLAHFRQC